MPGSPRLGKLLVAGIIRTGFTVVELINSGGELSL